MKKIAINENWEEVLEEDTSCFYAIICFYAAVFKHTASKAGYVKSFDVDLEKIEAEFESFKTQMADSENKPMAIFLVKLPNTEQVKNLLETGLYNGSENSEDIVDAAEQLINRMDTEILEKAYYKEELVEAKRKKKRQSSYNAWMSWTTGDPRLNDKHFNKCMGTDFEDEAEKAAEKAADAANDATEASAVSVNDGVPAPAADSGNSTNSSGESANFSGNAGDAGASGGEGGAIGESLELTEAKRYVKRYYVRPQNIFCSNKEEILKALVQVGDNNCSVYSLKSLSDHDDVHLLKPSDIIYYYDEGVLYDKNHVKVMDYDLFVKHEEERRKVGNVDAMSDSSFDKMYDDRLTDADLKKKEIKVSKPTHEALDLDEDKIVVGKIGQVLDLPPEISLLDRATVENFIDKLEPEELFTVGYVNPVYFYKELWEYLPIYKCTQMTGYTGVDFSRTIDDVNNDTNARISDAQAQIKQAKDTGKTIHVGADVDYASQNKLVKQKDKLGLGEARQTILFYPVNISHVCYFVKLPTQTKFIKVNAELLEQYIYDNLEKIEDKIRVDITKAKTKVYNTLYGKSVTDIDRNTRVGDPLDARFIKKYDRDKIQVRALYTSQIYYLVSNSGGRHGFEIHECLKKDLAAEAFNQNFKSRDMLGEDYDDVFTCCICHEETTGYGNNPEPVKHEGRCCDACNAKFVIPARLAALQATETNEDLNEASNLTPLEKMRLFDAGQRRENVKACGDQKLFDYRRICQNNGLNTALAAIEAEMISRGLIQQSTAQQKAATARNVVTPPPAPKNLNIFIADDFFIPEALEVRKANDTEELIKKCIGHPAGQTKALIKTLIYALCLNKPSGFIQALKLYVINFEGVSEADLKEIINNCLQNPDIITRLNLVTRGANSYKLDDNE